MADRSMLRIGAISAFVAFAMAIIVNPMLPRAADPANLQMVVQLAADSGRWVGVRVGAVFTALFWLGAFLVLYRSIAEGTAATWARLAFVGSLIGVIVFLVGEAVLIAVHPLAQAWAGAAGAQKAATFQAASAMVLAGYTLLSFWMTISFGVASILWGLAVALSNVYPKWLGWVAIVLGVVTGWAGLHAVYGNPVAGQQTLFFAILGLFHTIWMLIMGILMWRRAGAMAT